MTNFIKIIKISKTEAKLIFKSIWSLIYFIPIAIMTYLTLNSFWKERLGDNAGGWINNNSYITVYMSVALLILGVYIAQKHNELSEQLLTPIKNNLSKYLGLLIFSETAVFVPIIIIIGINFIRPCSSALLLNHLLYSFLQWFLEIFFFSSIGFSLGIFVKNKIAYYLTIIPAVLFSVFLSIIMCRFNPSLYFEQPLLLFDLLNTNINNPTIHKSLGTGFSFNSYNSFDMLFIFLLPFLILTIALLKDNLVKKNRSNKGILICTAVLGVLFSMNIYFSYLSQPDTDYSGNYMRNMSVETLKRDKDFTPISYNMNVNLKEKFSNDCILTLICDQSSETLGLKFDTANLKIDELKINGKKTEYSQKECFIYPNFGFKSNQKYTIELIYHGRINYATTVGQRLVFSDDQCSYIPEVYDWYPQIQNGRDSQIAFNLKVATNNNLVSNLSNKLEIPQNGIVSLSGTKDYIFLSTGYYASCKTDNINVIAPEELIHSEGFSDSVGSGNDDATINKVLYTYGNDFYQVDESSFKPLKEVMKKGGVIIIPASSVGSSVMYSFDDIVLITE